MTIFACICARTLMPFLIHRILMNSCLENYDATAFEEKKTSVKPDVKPVSTFVYIHIGALHLINGNSLREQCQFLLQK